MGRKSYVEHTAVTVQDIDWSVRFFVQVFGMSVTRQKENHGHLSQVWLDGGIQLVFLPEILRFLLMKAFLLTEKFMFLVSTVLQIKVFKGGLNFTLSTLKKMIISTVNFTE